MDFREVVVNTSSEGLELVSGLLYQYGLTGLMIEDEMDFKEFLENPNRDWDYIEEELVNQKSATGTRITFFVSDNVSGMEQLAEIKAALIRLQQTEKEFDLGDLILSVRQVKEEDWANNWKKYFKPFPVGEKIVIKPSWEDWEEKEGRTVLEIDPGHIFGTGSHETTRLCLELIEKVMSPDFKVLDIGCGSGILSIASLLFGAKSADAVDIDPNAIEIAYENAQRNQIQKEKYYVKSGNILDDEALISEYSNCDYDIVEANIVADVIIALCDLVPKMIRKDGYFLTSGIILERLDEVKENLEKSGFTILEIRTIKDWAAVLSCYKGE